MARVYKTKAASTVNLAAVKNQRFQRLVNHLLLLTRWDP